MLAKADIQKHKAQGSWRNLEKLAVEVVLDAERSAGQLMKPTLGGGTRLMLALEHRISDDIDLFISNPEWLGYLTPRLNNAFENRITGYSEQATALRLETEIGEIEFIVAMSLLGLPLDHDPDCAFALESIAEVLAKKLLYRGYALTPRDLFDWHAIQSSSMSVNMDEIFAVMGHKKVGELYKSLEQMPANQMAGYKWKTIKCCSPIAPLADVVDWAKGLCAEAMKPGGSAARRDLKNVEDNGAESTTCSRCRRLHCVCGV